MTALIERLGFEVDAIDVFCGYGGSSQGIHASGARVRAAANHSELSIECHSANFPDTDHWQADMVDPVNPMVRNRKGKLVPGKYLDPANLPRARYAWFSPACTHHSPGNAKKIFQGGLQMAMLEDEEWDEQAFVNSERSRVTMSCVLRYVEANRPEIVAVENVVEVTKWGPGRDGSTFRWWCKELTNMGYELQHLFLNSMFFPPCPQSRDRYYCVASRRGNRKPNLDYRPRAFCASDACGGRHVNAVQTFKNPTSVWPLPKWGKLNEQYRYTCPDCRAPVDPASWMALSAIDLTNLGPTLGERVERGKPVAPNTKERVRRAYAKYWNAPPVLLPEAIAAAVAQLHVAHGASVSVGNQGSDRKYDANRSRSVGEPLATLTKRNDQAVATIPLTIKNNGGMDEVGYRGHHAGEPLGAVVASASPQTLAFGALLPIRSGRPRSNAFHEQLATVVGQGSHHALCLLVPNRTNNSGHHASEATAPILTSATQAVVVAAAGNTYERGGYTRARHSTDPLFTQQATAEMASAFMPVLRGDHDQQNHISEQLDTVSAGGTHHALATAMFSKINGGPGDTAWHGIDEPLNTVTSRDTHGLILLPWVDQWRSDPALLTEQLATVTTHLRMSLAAAPQYQGEITDAMLDLVHFRMLEPDPELRRAMAFGDDYILLGNKGEMTAGLGNAVTPPTAAWITERCLATLSDDRERMAPTA